MIFDSKWLSFFGPPCKLIYWRVVVIVSIDAVLDVC